MYRYVGERGKNGCTVTIIDEEGGKEPLDPRRDLRNHSPEGFEWGFAGSGSAQLSLALLAHALGDDEMALRNYPDFKFRVVARLPQEFDLSDEQIRRSVAELEAARGRKRS
jgi:hypothetical protein